MYYQEYLSSQWSHHFFCDSLILRSRDPAFTARRPSTMGTDSRCVFVLLYLLILLERLRRLRDASIGPSPVPFSPTWLGLRQRSVLICFYLAMI